MFFLTPLLSVFSYFCLHYLWKYIENEFGIFTSFFSISIIILTSYGAYVYFKNSLYTEIDLGIFANRNELINELNNDLMLGVFERYNKERENYLNGDLIFLKEGERDSDENNINQFIYRQNERYFNEAENIDAAVQDSNLSFFGLSINSPKRSEQLFQDNNCFTLSNSHEICSPSVLADTFIQAATIAKNSQSEHFRGILDNIQLQNLNNLTGSVANTTIKTTETKNFNSRLLGSVGYSFHSNIKFARSRFENYISSLQCKITNKKVRNSLPGRLLSSTSIPDSGIKKNTKISTYKHSSIPSNLIESLDEKSTKGKGNSSTPTRKIYSSFLSPLPTSKPSPILLLTGKNKNE
ncbi:uncharacterized protein cubi_00604 [Cryptosporidium ubiquitum]|uniref:Uncharacterized protein n=1 Tax=Cryptosporidium ubiquitum TaxID=857276 RepID=A0A1J4MG21_9CRYT|nr:uncharacterized protein cubi_00604 [Cryptosporidium ubiquitum]OII71797.1 hypothetical protein cubi_00604 [Cryptosporidium ubiquitum]